MLKELIALRHELHQLAELSGQEKQTAERIKRELALTSPDSLLDSVGGHGLMATFDSGRPGPHLLFRADIDALPIPEANDITYRSQTDGVSHKCGHDGHATMLIGLAKRLQKEPMASGRCTLLFQPAEETGEGAKAVLADDRFKKQTFDQAFALHNIPGYAKGKILCRSGSFNPSVISCIIRLQGQTAHAAQPEQGINPDLAVASLITKINQLSNHDLHSENYLKATTICIALGERDYGISASRAEVHYTIRCLSAAKLDTAISQIKKLTAQISTRHQLKQSIEWLHEFTSCHNHESAVHSIKEVCRQLSYEYQEMEHPFEWGEDFGLFTSSIPGAMFGLGAGLHTPALHQADYDFPDDVIEHGVNLFYGLAQAHCK